MRKMRKSEAYEKIVAMKKEEALRKGTEFSEREAKRLADAEVLLGAAKRSGYENGKGFVYIRSENDTGA